MENKRVETAWRGKNRTDAKEKPFLHSVVGEADLTFRRACINQNEVGDYCSDWKTWFLSPQLQRKWCWAKRGCIVILSQIRLEEGQEIRWAGRNWASRSVLSREVRGLEKEDLGCLSHILFALGWPLMCPLERWWEPVSGGEVPGSPRVERVLQFGGDGKRKKDIRQGNDTCRDRLPSASLGSSQGAWLPLTAPRLETRSQAFSMRTAESTSPLLFCWCFSSCTEEWRC